MRLLVVICLLLITQQSLAQSAPQFSNVKNVNPGFQASYPSQLTSCNGKVFFVANEPATGFEVWTTDGTTTGTKLIKDINNSQVYRPEKLMCVGNKVYFTQANNENGVELWSTDGTTDGTMLISDINDGSKHSFPDELTEYNGRLYFVATSSTSGREIWVTSGTPGSSSILKDLSQDPTQVHGPSGLKAALGKLFFTSQRDGEKHLYVSDGTTAGTFKLKDFSSIGGAGPSHITEYNGKIYFVAFDPVYGYDLWTSDGTETGTQLFMDINPGSGNSNPSSFVVCNGKLFFKTFDHVVSRLWMSDGTVSGTQQVSPDAAPMSELFVYDNKVYFTDDDGTGELWVSDGTPSGTMELNTDVSAPEYFYQFYGKMYFTAKSNNPNLASYGRQLWQTDGTKTGTKMLLPNPLPGGPIAATSAHVSFANIGSDLLIPAAYDANENIELWKMSLFPTAVNDQATSSPQYLYPNPTTGTVNIQLPIVKDASVKIYSLTGQLLLQQSISEALTTIDVNQLAPGMYITHITTDGHATIEKLLKH